jgi:large subunit ribosomal protein L21
MREVQNMYAIIRTGGKQYRVSEGDVLNVEKLNVEEGQEVVFDEVLTVVNDGDVKVGAPTVAGAKVTAKVAKQGKADKIFVFKYRAKSNYRKRQGHRQPFTQVEITSIEA